MAAVQIDVNLHIGYIHTLENNASRCRIIHTVQAPEKCTLSGTGRSEHRNDIAFVDGDIDSFQDLKGPKAFPKINYVYHSSSGSFPII